MALLASLLSRFVILYYNKYCMTMMIMRLAGNDRREIFTLNYNALYIVTSSTVNVQRKQNISHLRVPSRGAVLKQFVLRHVELLLCLQQFL